MKNKLTKQLRPLTILDANALARIGGGGESASTSTSGTPAAGDDTIGDSFGSVSLQDFSIVKNLD
jgi:hypothetical protein